MITLKHIFFLGFIAAAGICLYRWEKAQRIALFQTTFDEAWTAGERAGYLKGRRARGYG